MPIVATKIAVICIWNGFERNTFHNSSYIVNPRSTVATNCTSDSNNKTVLQNENITLLYNVYYS